eukprot:355149-Chlamydomonas_euryale.AAC.4
MRWLTCCVIDRGLGPARASAHASLSLGVALAVTLSGCRTASPGGERMPSKYGKAAAMSAPGAAAKAAPSQAANPLRGPPQPPPHASLLPPRRAARGGRRSGEGA